jgi:hypothetical protein
MVHSVLEEGRKKRKEGRKEGRKQKQNKNKTRGCG